MLVLSNLAVLQASFLTVFLSLFCRFSIVLVCSLFWLVLCGLVCCVILGLFIEFLVISLHGFLSCSKLFVLFVSLAIAAVNVHLRYFLYV